MHAFGHAVRKHGRFKGRRRYEKNKKETVICCSSLIGADRFKYCGSISADNSIEVAEEPAPSAVQETPAAEPAAEPVEVQDPAPAEISVPEGTSSDNAAETAPSQPEGTGETSPEISAEVSAEASGIGADESGVSQNPAEAASGTTGTEAEGTGESTVPEVLSEAAAAVSSLQSARSLSLPHILQMVQFRPARKQFRRKDFNLSTGPRPMSRL